MVSSLISPVLSPPAGSSANPSPQGFREPAPPRVPLSPTALKRTVCPDKPCHGQRRVRATWTRWDTLGVLGYQFVNSWQSPGRGHACVVPQTFHHCRAVGGREVGHPARRLGGPQEAATEHVPNTPALPHRQAGRLGCFLRTFLSFLPRVPPELEAEARRSRVSVSSRQGTIG